MATVSHAFATLAQTCLSDQANKVSSLIKWKDAQILIDAPLDMSPSLNHVPLPLVPSSPLNYLREWVPRACPPSLATDSLAQVDLREAGGRVFLNSLPEFAIPDVSLALSCTRGPLTRCSLSLCLSRVLPWSCSCHR